jgi:hypothetical protein
VQLARVGEQYRVLDAGQPHAARYFWASLFTINRVSQNLRHSHSFIHT